MQRTAILFIAIILMACQNESADSTSSQNDTDSTKTQNEQPKEIEFINEFTDQRTDRTYDLHTQHVDAYWFLQDLVSDKDADIVVNDDLGMTQLYTWDEAQKACPDGWIIPSDEDIRSIMSDFADGADEGSDNTHEAFEGLQNVYQMNLLPRGFYVKRADSNSDEPEAVGEGEFAYYWTSTEDQDNPSKAFALRVDFKGKRTYLQSYNKSGKGSCRCIQYIK